MACYEKEETLKRSEYTTKLEAERKLKLVEAVKKHKEKANKRV